MKRFLYLATIAALAAGCRTLDIQEPTGTISVNLEPEVIVKSCAWDDTDNYTVSVTSGTAVSGLPYQAAYKDFEPLSLPMGTYTVSAWNCTEEESVTGYGLKRLYGSTNATLSLENPDQEVALECVLVNSLVSVIFDSSVTGVFDGLKVDITSGTRTVSISESGKVKEAWFNPAEEISWTISGTVKENGKIVSQSNNMRLEARKNLKINVHLTNGQISMTPNNISINQISSATEVPVDGTNPYE